MPFLFLSIVFAALNSTLLKKVRLSSAAAVYLFNLLSCAVWLLLLFFINGFQLHITVQTLLFGLLYGVTQALFIFFKTAAMNSGPMSVTTLIGNASLLLSVFVCYFCWSEPISGGDVIGLALLLGGIFLATYQKSNTAISKRWYPFSLLFLITAAGVGLSFKAYAKAGGNAINDMMLVAALTMLLSYLFLCTACALIDKRKGAPRAAVRTQFCLYALAAGALSCLYNRLNIRLASELAAVVFFPVFNGGVVILSALLAALFFRERLSKKQALGMGLGVIGICMIGIL